MSTGKHESNSGSRPGAPNQGRANRAKPDGEQMSGSITQRKTVEESLRASEERLRKVFQENMSLMAISDVETGLLFDVNQQFLETLGYTRDEVVGRSSKELGLWVDVADRDRVAGLVKRHGSARNEEVAIRAKDGSVIAGLFSATLVDLSDRRLLLTTMQDITKLREAERREAALRDELARSERIESLAVLAGGVAHDLNNVLGPLVTLPDIVAEDVSGIVQGCACATEDIEEALEVMKYSAKRAAVIVQDLMFLSRRGRYDRSPLDVNAVHCVATDCEHVEDLRQSHPGVAIERGLAKGRLMVLGEETHLARAACNIVRNAVEAIPGEGKVTVRTRKKVVNEPLSGYVTIPPGEYAVIEVSDTGVGIETEQLDRIFEPFFSSKKQGDRSGSGLGLSVVHGIIRDHDGFVDVISTPGKGTTMSLYLPLVSRPVPAGGKSTHGKVRGGSEHILVIDDEPTQLANARMVLKRLGYRVTEARSGREALEIVEKARKTGTEQPFDLVLVDMIMDDLDGAATYAGILELCPGVKAIAHSGHAAEVAGQAMLSLGASWLKKPWTLDDLSRAVRERLDG